MRVCLAFLLLLVLTPAASAGTVRMTDRVERDGGETSTYGSVEVAAAAGEINTVELRYERGGVVVRDATAPLQGDARCRNADPHTVVCRDPALDGITELYVDLGDGADRARTPEERGLAYVVVRGGPGDDDLAGVWATLEGGDGDDRLTGDAGAEHLDGGAGNDVLEGHAEGDYLDGGTGDDVVRGGGGHDSLYGGGVVGDGLAAGTDLLDGGPGNDGLDDQDGLGGGGPAGADTVIGGEGRDFVHSYVLRRRGVTVDLTRPDGHGEPGENDRVTGIEDVYGSSGDDTLIGDAGPNRLEGNRGQDDLRGGGGDDHLVSTAGSAELRPNARAGRYGPDRVSGDAGDDLIETQATLESQVICGDGSDRVVMPGFSADRALSSRGPLVSRTCERLAMGGNRRGRGVSITPYPTAVTRGGFVFTLQAFDCCRQRMELQTVKRRPRVLVRRTLRAKTLRLRVRGASRHRTLRGKITNVARNRFVWRFRRGF